MKKMIYNLLVWSYDRKRFRLNRKQKRLYKQYERLNNKETNLNLNFWRNKQ